jgi:hypothetical protein
MHLVGYFIRSVFLKVVSLFNSHPSHHTAVFEVLVGTINALKQYDKNNEVPVSF